MTDLDLMTPLQIAVMFWAAIAAWAYLFITMALRARARRIAARRRATYRHPARGRVAIHLTEGMRKH